MEERTFVPLDEGSLKEMQSYALEERERLFRIGDGKYEPYRERFIAVCLCQGAAQHILDRTYGVKDVDIWFFFDEHPCLKLPHRGNMRKSRVVEFTTMGERRIDFMKKMIPSCFVAERASQTIQRYLCHCNTGTAARLREKPVIGLFPDSLLGEVIWSGKKL